MSFSRRNKQLTMAERLTALNRIGVVLMSEHDEGRLLHLIAKTARDLTGATYAAFTLRPLEEDGHLSVPSDGKYFYPATIIGVSKKEEALLHHTAFSGKGILAPIFHSGVSVLVSDIATFNDGCHSSTAEAGENPLAMIATVPGHPGIHSFLGAPLLNSYKEVLGGLLLGHCKPDQFTSEDEVLLVGLASQAAVSLENARLYRLTQRHTQERAEIETRLHCLQVVLDELPCGVYLVNGPDARLVLANRAAALLCGAVWSHGQPLSDHLQKNHIRTFDEHGLPLPIDQSPTYRALRKGERVYHSQITICCEDGTMFPLLVNAINLDAPISPLFAEQKPLALVVHQDMRILKEAEQLKDEFIGMATHELRTPLAIMLGFAQTLLVQTANGHGPELADWQKEALEGIDHASSRMAELVNDVLDIARIQAKRLTFYPLPADIVALANRVIRRLQVTTQKHRITLCTAVPDFVVNVDPRRLEQVLSNLLLNAIKYSPEGGNIEVTITEDEYKGCVNIAVHDYGIGIPAQQQTRIFGRFERASNARLQNIQGTGLGLYLSRALVEQQGGSIWFESIEGQGSTFTIALPSS